MKKYFTYVKSSRAACQKPGLIVFEGKNYTSFCNSYSLALTTEPCGGIELFTENDGTYPNMSRLVNREGVAKKIDFAKVFAEANSLGYKLKKSEVTTNSYLMFYDGGYFRLGLVDSTYAIINDGEVATVYHAEGEARHRLTIETSLGIAVIMPVTYDPDNGATIIHVEQ